MAGKGRERAKSGSPAGMIGERVAGAGAGVPDS